MSTISLEKYVDAFCFSSIYIDKSGRSLFYLWEKNGKKTLHLLDLENEDDLKKGEELYDYDFSQGSFSIEDHDEKRSDLYIYLDESNKENFNLFRFNLKSKTLKQLTDFSYIRGVVFNEDYSRLWCYDKIKLPDGTFRSDVYEIDLISLEKKFLFNDENQDYRIGWTFMPKLPEEDTFVFTVDYLNQRKKTNLCRFNLKEKKWDLLLPAELEELGNPSLHENKPTPQSIIFESVHEGFQNAYSFNLETREFHKVTDLNCKNEEMYVFHRRSGKQTIVLLKENENFVLQNYNLQGEKTTITLSAPLYLFETEYDLWGLQTHSDHTNKILKLTLLGQKEKILPLTSVAPEQLEHTKTTWVSYPTFDGKSVKALLHSPKGPLKAAMVLAFYGGNEVYSRYIQMYAEMGIAILSPAVRGSWGWGREWEKLLEGDLGGNEILDVIWGAKYLQQTLMIPESKIGVYGGSHGGYATLRAITMPEGFKGVENCTFPFGFAYSQVGFADLHAFYRDSRIADWLIHLLGPYNEEKYSERSPLTFFDNLKTPLLIINGKNDSRVPFSTMEKFIEKLRKSDKVYDILIHEKQGHGASNRAAALAELETIQIFLQKYI